MGYNKYMWGEKISDFFSPKAYKFAILFAIITFLLIGCNDYSKYVSKKCEILSYKGSKVVHIKDSNGDVKYYMIAHKYTVQYTNDGYKDISVKQSLYNNIVKNNLKYIYIYEKVPTENASLLQLLVFISCAITVGSFIAMLSDD